MKTGKRRWGKGLVLGSCACFRAGDRLIVWVFLLVLLLSPACYAREEKSAWASWERRLVGLRAQVERLSRVSGKGEERIKKLEGSYGELLPTVGMVQAELADAGDLLEEKEVPIGLWKRHATFAARWKANRVAVDRLVKQVLGTGVEGGSKELKSLARALREQEGFAGRGRRGPPRSGLVRPPRRAYRGPDKVVPAYRGGKTKVEEEDLLCREETVAPEELRALAREELEGDWERIARFVKNRIAYEHYYGSAKTAPGTLRDRAGNDFDQASLLIALLRAAGYPARYVHGSIEIRDAEVRSWMGVSNAEWGGAMFASEGRPGVDISSASGVTVAVREEHVWVEARVGSPPEWKALDPSFVWVSPPELVVRNELTRSLGPFQAGKGKIDSNTEKETADYLKKSAGLLAKGKVGEGLEGGAPIRLPSLGFPPVAPGGRSLYREVAVLEEKTGLGAGDRIMISFRITTEEGEVKGKPVPLSLVAGKRVVLSYEYKRGEEKLLAGSWKGPELAPLYLTRVVPCLRVEGREVLRGKETIPGRKNLIGITIMRPGYEAETCEKRFISGSWLGIAIGGGRTRPALLSERIGLMEKALARRKKGEWTEDTLGELLCLTGFSFLAEGDAIAAVRQRILGVVDIAVPPAIVITSLSPAEVDLLDPRSSWEYELGIDQIRNERLPVSRRGSQLDRMIFTLSFGMTASYLEEFCLEQIFQGPSICTIGVLRRGANDRENSLPGTVTGGLLYLGPVRPVRLLDWEGWGQIAIDPASGNAVYDLAGGVAGGFLARRLSRKDVEGFLSRKTCTRLRAVNDTVKLVGRVRKGEREQSGKIASELVYLYLIESGVKTLGKEGWQRALFGIAMASAFEWHAVVGK